MTKDMAGDPVGSDGATRLRLCWLLSPLWLAAFLGSALLPGGAGMALNAVQTVLLIAVLVLHASLLYGWAGAAAFVAIAVAIGTACEVSSVATGFPFGLYTHHSPGPRMLGVPLQGMVIYMCYGWYAWIVARVISLARPGTLQGAARFTTPVIAALVLAGFDYAIDPILSSVAGLWTFAHPSGQFGVPLTNYLGWIFTGWLIFQALALIEPRFRAAAASGARRYWLLPCVMWSALAIQYPIMWANATNRAVVIGDRTFVIGDIFEASVAGSIFTVLLIGLLGTLRVLQAPQEFYQD